MTLGRIASWCYRRRWRVLCLWFLALIAVVTLGRSFGGANVTAFQLPDVESRRAYEMLQERFPERSGDTGEIAFIADDGVSDPAVKAHMEVLFDQVAKLPHVTGVISPYVMPPGLGISPDGTTGVARVQFDTRAFDVPRATAVQWLRAIRAANEPGIQIEAGGHVAEAAAEREMPSSEIIGLLAAIVILLVAFGSVIAMGLPIATAVLGLGVGVGGLTLLSAVVDVPEFAPQMAAMIGLGVGIDYALFIVTRYRAELHLGREPEDATRIALETSGRAVLFAGCVVIISLLGMFLINLSFVRGLAMGASLAVATVMLASITLLPALLGFTGRSIDKVRVPGLHRDESQSRSSMWFRWSRQVQRHPAVYAMLGTVMMVTLAIPALSLRLGMSDAGNHRPETTTRKAYDLVADAFGPGFNGPLLLAVVIPRDDADYSAQLEVLREAVAGTAGIKNVLPAQVNKNSTAAVIAVLPTSAPQAEATTALIDELRDDVIPEAIQGTDLVVMVSGSTATGNDMSAYLASRLPVFIGTVLVLSFLLLMIVFRSIVVALKAAVMNVLSIAAAYGVVVAVFQWGWMSNVLGVKTTGPVEPFIPMMLFAILFGLSMDYEVFLLSRVREEYLRTHDNALAVADGLAATARVITAAAAVMIAVFGAFVLGDERILKVFGLGLASAIFIDATLVRMLLVPATMELLGDANWWLPKWMDRILPHMEVEATPLADNVDPIEVPN